MSEATSDNREQPLPDDVGNEDGESETERDLPADTGVVGGVDEPNEDLDADARVAPPSDDEATSRFVADSITLVRRATPRAPVDPESDP